MPRGTKPKRAGVWENVDTSWDASAPLTKSWWIKDPDAGQVHRYYLLLAFGALGATLLLLDALGGFDGAASGGGSPWTVAGFLAAYLQLFVFTLLLLFTIQAKGGPRRLVWLSLFFASTLLHACRGLTAPSLAQFLEQLALVGWSAALLGFGVDFYSASKIWRRRLEGLVAGLWIAGLVGATWLWTSGPEGAWTLRRAIDGLAFLPLLVFVATWRSHRPSTQRRGKAVRKTFRALTVLHLLYLLDVFQLVPRPGLLASPLFLPLLSCLVFYVALQTYIDALRSVTFYSRFIRPGLERLLDDEGTRLLGSEKLFRGRKTVIMQIDMANYTRTTFDMPYGMRRLFQDLWFTRIDRVVAHQVFLDKSLGDGSVYCFEDGLPGGSCRAALEAALEIRDRQVANFDAAYRRHLDTLLQQTPELAGRAETYFEAYRAKAGHDFAQRRTQVRIALTSGYVDEGLWGLTSQSHYDVHGGPLIVAARLESQAANSEIIFDDAFLEELEEEAPGLLQRDRLEHRSLDLKGIGHLDAWVLPVLGSHSETPVEPPAVAAVSHQGHDG